MAAQPFEVHSPTHSQCSATLFCTTTVSCTVPVCSAHGIVMWRAVSDLWRDEVINLCKCRNYFKPLTISDIHFCRQRSPICVLAHMCKWKYYTTFTIHVQQLYISAIHISHHQAEYKTLNYALKMPSHSLSEKNCFCRSFKSFIIHSFYINLLETSHIFMYFYMFLFNCALM